MIAPLSIEASDRLQRENAIFRATLQLVRNYPDFDDGSVVGDAIDVALRGEVHPTVELMYYLSTQLT